MQAFCLHLFFCFIFVREIEENVTFPLKDIYLQHSTSMIYCFSLEGRHGYSLIKGVTVMTILEVIALLNLLATVIFGILSYIKK